MQSKIRLAILIFFLALSARLLYIEQIKDDVLFYYPIVDSGFYDYRGAELAEGGGRDEGPASRVPFYRYFLGSIYRLGGHNVYLARFVQAAAGAATATFIFLLSAGIFNRSVGLIAGVASALYWPFIAFGAKFLPVNLALLFSVMSVFFVERFFAKKKVLWIFAGGIFLACACLARSNIFLVFPALLFWLFRSTFKADGTRNAVFYSVFLVLGFLVVITPPLAKDYSQRREVIPIQKNYGVGIYFGADIEHVRIRPGYRWKTLMRELHDEGITGTKERNLYWIGRTKELILQRPLTYLDNLADKIYLLWNYYEFSPRENINYFRKKSRFLSFPLVNFGFIAPFSILGILMAWKGFGIKTVPIYLFLIPYEISLLPFMPLARYRLPAVPFLIIFASLCIFGFFEAGRKKQWNSLYQYAALLIPLFILMNTNPFRGYLEDFSRPRYYEGRARMKRIGGEKEALSELMIAAVRHPDDADIYDYMGYIYVRQGELKKAERCYLMALEIEPRLPKTMNSLGIIYAKQGNVEKAKLVFKEVIEKFSAESASAHTNLGNCYRMEGRHGMAEKEYRRALFLRPDDKQVLRRLETLLQLPKKP